MARGSLQTRLAASSLLLLVALLLSGAARCSAQGAGGLDAAARIEGRALLQAAPDERQPQPRKEAQPGWDITVEEAILKTYEPGPEEGGAQQQAPAKRQPLAQEGQQQARRLREQQVEGRRRAMQAKAAQEADHAKHLERQRQEAAAADERLAALRDAERQQASLGRGSLRARKAAPKQAPISGSNKDDIFAQKTERQLNTVRARLEQLRQEAADAEAARAAGQPRLQRQQQEGQGQAQQAQQQAAQQQPRAPGAPRTRPSIPLVVVLLMTVVMAAAGGLGALPFFFVRTMSDGATGVATAIACGVMLAASFDLVHEGQPYGASLTILGVLLGGWFIRWVQQLLAGYEDIQFGSLQGSSARKTVLMVGIMAAHALGEGCAVGVSFCGDRGWAQGVLTTLAIGVHNIPEGLAKATVLVGQGVSPRRALLWSVATCLPQPLVAVPSFIFVEAFTMILPVALGFAAGCMIWMVFAELLPDALERADGAAVATAATAAAAGLEGFRMFFSSLEQADGSFGGGAAAAHAVGTLGRMGAPLAVLLPAVAAAAAGGGGLGSTALPAPVAWGLAAAVAASSGGGSLLDQLLFRPKVPALHTAAAGAVGAALAVLLHRQLLGWADSSAALVARKLESLALAKRSRSDADGIVMGANGGVNGGADVEALEYSSMYQQHHLHHHPHKHHPHAAAPPPGGLEAGGAPGGYLPAGGGSMNGFGGSSSSLGHQAAPYHRGGAASTNGSALQLASGAVTPSGFGLGGATTPTTRGGWRQAGLLPAPQLAAGATALAALAVGAVTTGWHLACTLLLLGEDRSAAILPAALLLLAGPGLGAGALARTLPSRSSAAAGGWAGGGLATLAALAAALSAARAHESAHTAALVRRLLYPFGITDTAEALAGGALCVAAWQCLAAGSALKPRSARGGLALGLLAAGLLAALRYALCTTTPYCLSVNVLLAQAAR